MTLGQPYEEARSIRRKLKKEGEKKTSIEKNIAAQKRKLADELLEAAAAIEIHQKLAFSYSYRIDEEYEKLNALMSDNTLLEEEFEKQKCILEDQIDRLEFVFDKTVLSWVKSTIRHDSLSKAIMHLNSLSLQ